MIKRISVFLLAVLTLFTAGCVSTPKEADKNSGTGSTVECWGVPATEKVLRDYHSYEDVKGIAQIDIIAARGEYEGAQIIMTAKGNISSYDIVLSDLKTASGTIFPKKNIAVFKEKYIHVSKIYDSNGAPTGWYPDALLPFETAKEYGENQIADGDNQGLYFTFNIGINMAAGVYSGEFILTADGKEHNIPVRLDITEATVSQTTHSKSVFLNNWQYGSGELNTTEAMFDAYTKACIEYRIMPQTIINYNSHSQEDISRYTEIAYQYMKDARVSNIGLPTVTAFDGGVSTLNTEIFEKYLKSYASKSFEEKFDMFAKTTVYLTGVDEPKLNNLDEELKNWTDAYKACVRKVADELAADTSISAENKGSVIESLRELKCPVTNEYTDDYAPYIDTWCPQVQYYDSEQQREVYKNQDERWWYTCIAPRVPYPTYHTEDTLLSARLLSWMQAQYDVVGNLFWATNIYAEYNGVDYVNIEDYYGGNASRFPQVNGDGYLFYPGGQYGLDKPVSSLRLEAIRDGLEEYELLYAIKEKYAEISKASGHPFNGTAAIDSLTTSLYSGTRVGTTSELFSSARNTLLQLSVLAQSKAEVCIVDYNEDFSGNVIFKVYVNDGYVLKNDGEAVKSLQSVNGGKIYTVTQNRDGDVNAVRLSVEIDGKEYEYFYKLGGEVNTLSATTIDKSGFSNENATIAVSETEADVVMSGAEGKMLKLEFGRTINKSQSIKITDCVFSNLGAKHDKLVLRIYNPSSRTIKLTVAFKFETQSLLNDMVSDAELKHGMNEVVIRLSSVSWNRMGGVAYARFTLSGDSQNGKNENAKIVYLYDYTLFKR